MCIATGRKDKKYEKYLHYVINYKQYFRNTYVFLSR